MTALERYAPHMQAALSEGLCPDCPTTPLTSRVETLTDCAGAERTVIVLTCPACAEEWWPTDALDPGASGGWLILTGQAIRDILAVRTWDGQWQAPR